MVIRKLQGLDGDLWESKNLEKQSKYNLKLNTREIIFDIANNRHLWKKKVFNDQLWASGSKFKLLFPEISGTVMELSWESKTSTPTS